MLIVEAEWGFGMGAGFVVSAAGSDRSPEAGSVVVRRCGVPVAESVLAPPGPIPNPVVTQDSAGEYYGGDAMGGEAAAGAPHRRPPPAETRGGAVAARWAHNPKVGGSNPPPATSARSMMASRALPCPRPMPGVFLY